MQGILAQEKLTDQSLSSPQADASSVFKACLIRPQYIDVSLMTYFSGVNKSAEL